ncbi:MAG: hypothetical protein WC223_04435 [Bacteroidales bacterium]|jgi:hypothetical protein
MQEITTISGLKNAIQLLEVEQAANEHLLKEQFHHTYESLKPVNILKSTLHDIASSPYLINNILGTTTGLATGYLTKKIAVGSSKNIFRKLIGSVLQFGVTNVVAQHPDTIKSIAQFIFQNIFNKKETNSKSCDI